MRAVADTLAVGVGELFGQRPARQLAAARAVTWLLIYLEAGRRNNASILGHTAGIRSMLLLGPFEEFFNVLLEREIAAGSSGNTGLGPGGTCGLASRSSCTSRVDLPTLSAILGHTSIQMTMRYVHPAEEQKRLASGKLENFRVAGIVEAMEKSRQVSTISATVQ